MGQTNQRIEEDLRGLIAGQVLCDELDLQLYASDASIYQFHPLCVVRPTSTADVAACLKYASENAIAVHARGAGTGLAGESLGSGMVIDFSYAMRRILATDAQSVRVQPGVVHAMLVEHLHGYGRTFGPDPAMSHVTTLGSVIANDASGSRRLRHGSARDHVLNLQVVLADGTAMELGRHPVVPASDEPGPPRRRELVAQLAHLIETHRETIQRWSPQCPTNRSGYALGDILVDGQLDLARLLVGSEGTLALITEATLATQPRTAHRGVVLLLFDSLERASRAVLEILPFAPSACDLMDRRHLSLARENDVRYELIIPQQTEAVLLVEQDGSSAAEVRQRIGDVVTRVERKKKLAFGSHTAIDDEEVDLLWKLARDFAPTLARMKGSSRPVPFVEDLAVPPETLPAFLVQLQNVLKRHHVTASLFGHAGHGQLHIRPFLDLADPNDVRKMQPLAEDLYGEVSKVGGTISGEHGDGLSRTPFLQRQLGPLVEVFGRVKEIFDPAGILNPGKIVPREGSELVRDLRPATCSVAMGSAAVRGQGGAHRAWPFQLQLAWQPHELAQMTQHCNGCGACRSQSADVRMCPVFRLLPREEASPRAKANLMRGVVTGELEMTSLARDEFKAIADLCIHCHMCRLECPSAVDIPRLMVEGKAAYVATNGLRPTDWLMTRIDRLSALGCRFHAIANWAIGNRQARWLIEKVFGIAQGRKLPRFARHPFLQQAARRRLTHATRHRGPKILYFVDTYANYHDSQLAEAVVAVMEHNGIAVFVEPRQLHSAMPMIANGAVDQARHVARQNVNLLADAVRQGYTVVASEPSAVLCLTREYPQLIDDDDTRLVAAHAREACHYLWQLHQTGKLQLDFKPLHVAVSYHAPCHLKALEVGTPGENLLRLIPGLTVHRIERGCSGMAGTYGLKRENYRSSLRAGWGLISELRNASVQAGTTECCTCKMQMELASSKPTIHPLKLLALAYGLIPEIGSLLTTPGEAFIVT